ncbi:hypothetical protein AB835_11290 [Candidatus Endobugula sertula]|uniref:Glycosyl transferase family 1 n=1 Tax=Candidatus Endobugula sertula TaxID=62101 RepID=A0A1D2QN34_9GAMM|nr:hypothetical protein AB835_11290 [Candidatus Endobugula sertula]
MQILFVHQNFPGQYRYLVQYYSQQPEWDVYAIGEKDCVKRQLHLIPKGITVLGYDMPKVAKGNIPHNIKYTVDHTVRADALAAVLCRQKKKGLNPSVILAHPGWGEGLYLREIFPSAKLIYFFEYYFSTVKYNINFDPEFPSGLAQQLHYRLNNATNLVSLDVADIGVSPTYWQQSTYPKEYHSKIRVIHDGVNTQLVKPRLAKSVTFKNSSHGELTLRHTDEMITYSVRNLEPSRGFHRYMRALPRLQALRPNARFVIVGGDEKSYSDKHPSGKSWREVMLDEVGQQLDMERVIFTGKIPYQHLLDLFSLTAIHIYFTTPFVLSWSLMEAMACEATVLASSTEPVIEVIKEGENGFLFDFFDEDELVAQVEKLMGSPELRSSIGKAARDTIVKQYDLQNCCLFKHTELVEEKLQ